MAEQGIPPSKVFMSFTDLTTDGYMGYSADQLNEFIYTGQSIYYINLIICQWGNVLASRTRTRSILQANPFYGHNKNYYIFYAMIISLAIALIILYIPGIQDVLQYGTYDHLSLALYTMQDKAEHHHVNQSLNM
ncbi:hypothetical protein G6F68_019255 [Rhizopus microsporus]|nr:hypothetical protein G6F68_019255 [Rhizopus microsporus]